MRHDIARPEKFLLIDQIGKHLLIGNDFVDDKLFSKDQSRHIPAVESADSEVMVNLRQIMRRNLAICPLICGKRRYRFALQASLLTND